MCFLDVPTAPEEHCHLMLPALCLPCLLICTSSCWCLDRLKGHTEKLYPGVLGGQEEDNLATVPFSWPCPGSMLPRGGSRIRCLDFHIFFMLSRGTCSSGSIGNGVQCKHWWVSNWLKTAESGGCSDAIRLGRCGKRCLCWVRSWSILSLATRLMKW